MGVCKSCNKTPKVNQDNINKNIEKECPQTKVQQENGKQIMSNGCQKVNYTEEFIDLGNNSEKKNEVNTNLDEKNEIIYRIPSNKRNYY